MSVHILPNAEKCINGYIHTFCVAPFETPMGIYRFDEGVSLTTIYVPGVYEFILSDTSTPQGVWKFSLPVITNTPDMVNHPPHYTSSKAYCANCKESIECIEIARHMSFNIGNAVKYLWRHELKGGLEDLKKAKWYINDAIKQLEDKEELYERP